MGQFEYTRNLTQAHVSFHAHKFPYTSSVYYQCNVRLCLKEGDGCDDVVSNLLLLCTFGETLQEADEKIAVYCVVLPFGQKSMQGSLL